MIALMRLMSVMIKIISKFTFNYMNHNLKFKVLVWGLQLFIFKQVCKIRNFQIIQNYIIFFI